MGVGVAGGGAREGGGAEELLSGGVGSARRWVGCGRVVSERWVAPIVPGCWGVLGSGASVGRWGGRGARGARRPGRVVVGGGAGPGGGTWGGCWQAAARFGGERGGPGVGVGGRGGGGDGRGGGAVGRRRVVGARRRGGGWSSVGGTEQGGAGGGEGGGDSAGFGWGGGGGGGARGGGGRGRWCWVREGGRAAGARPSPGVLGVVPGGRGAGVARAGVCRALFRAWFAMGGARGLGGAHAGRPLVWVGRRGASPFLRCVLRSARCARGGGCAVVGGAYVWCVVGPVGVVVVGG